MDDVIKAILLSLGVPEIDGEIINIASGQPIKIRTVLEEVIKITGKGSPRYGEVPYRKGENMALYADIKKARKLLKWEPEISLNEGLKITINSYLYD